VNNKFAESHKVLYGVIWLPLAVAYLPFGAVRLLAAAAGFEIKILKQWENFIDDPIDDLKHKLHGATIPIIKKKIMLPRWLMQGGGDPQK
jgi:hypothetical protein